MSSEVKEDASKPEKWPFAEPQPMREDQVKNAVNFLSHPKVRGTPMVQRFSFLERKGLSREEIEEAFRRCPDPPTSDGAKTIGPPEGRVPTLPTQAQVVDSAQSQLTSGPSSIVPTFSKSHWSQLILGASLIAAAGVGTGYLVQRVLAPKFKAWLRDLILEGEKETEFKREGQAKSPKLAPLKEAVGAAAAAATAAAEVANSSDLPKLQSEDWEQLRSLINSLESKTEELKGTLTSMSQNSQDAEEHRVSASHAHAENASFDKGAEQIHMKHGVHVLQSKAGDKTSQFYGQSSNFSSFMSQSEEKPWWRRKTGDVETHASPKQRTERTLHVPEVEVDFDQ